MASYANGFVQIRPKICSLSFIELPLFGAPALVCVTPRSLLVALPNKLSAYKEKVHLSEARNFVLMVANIVRYSTVDGIASVCLLKIYLEPMIDIYHLMEQLKTFHCKCQKAQLMLAKAQREFSGSHKGSLRVVRYPLAKGLRMAPEPCLPALSSLAASAGDKMVCRGSSSKYSLILV